MAPELWRGEPAGAASDQFAFCVALYEALFGARPFDGSSMSELATRIERGERSPSPREREVPAEVRIAVLRGLAPDPAARFASVEALIDELERSTRRGRRRRLAAASAAALALVAVAAAASWRHARSVCRGAETIAATAFTSADQVAIERSLGASGVPFADDTWRSVRSRMQSYLSRWASTRTAACEATRLRREQSEELLDLRLQCLDHKLLDTRALVDVLAHADGEVATRAVQAVASLPDFDDCSDARALRGMPRPLAGTEASVEHVALELASTRGLQRAGRYAEALKVANRAVDQARAIRYTPSEAEALATRAELERMVDEYAASKRDSIAALGAAEVSRADGVAVRAAKLLAEATGLNEQHFEEATQWLGVAEALLQRMPRDSRLRMRVLGTKGDLLSFQRRDAEALAASQESLAIAERELAADDPEIGSQYISMAHMLLDQRRLREAQVYIERARDARARVYGPLHPAMCNVWELVGSLALHQERFADALIAKQKALALAEKNHDAAEQAVARLNVGQTLTELGRLDEAEETLRKALASVEQTFGASHPFNAVVWFNLAAVAQHRKQWAVALERNRRAQELDRRAFGDDSPDVAETVVVEGLIDLETGHAADAERAFARAMKAYEKAFGKEHAQLLPALTGLGRAELALGNPALALPPLERAVALIDKYPGGPSEDAEALFALARALVQSGGDRARARGLATHARGLYESVAPRGAEQRSQVERWLAESR
jgi:tetratricopeptide (TPR) repeat protein